MDATCSPRHPNLLSLHICNIFFYQPISDNRLITHVNIIVGVQCGQHRIQTNVLGTPLLFPSFTAHEPTHWEAAGLMPSLLPDTNTLVLSSYNPQVTPLLLIYFLQTVKLYPQPRYSSCSSKVTWVSGDSQCACYPARVIASQPENRAPGIFLKIVLTGVLRHK